MRDREQNIWKESCPQLLWGCGLSLVAWAIFQIFNALHAQLTDTFAPSLLQDSEVPDIAWADTPRSLPGSFYSACTAECKSLIQATTEKYFRLSPATSCICSEVRDIYAVSRDVDLMHSQVPAA